MTQIGTSTIQVSTGRKTKQEETANAALIVTYINIVLYALCYQLQRPVEPFLVEQLSKSMDNEQSNDSRNITRIYGQLQSFFSIIQTIGSPIVGVLLDRFGVRVASTIVFASSGVSYYILSTAKTSLSTLFYSKVPTAFQHAFLVAQAIAAIACQGDEAIRAQALGRVTTAYTVGATIGPMMGGYLAEHGDLYVGAKLAVLGSLLSVLLSLLFLPDEASSSSSKAETEDDEEESLIGSNGNKSEDDEIATAKASSDKSIRKKQQHRSLYNEMKHSIEIASRAELWPLLLIKVVSGVASSMFDTILPIVLTQQLHYDPATLGLLMSCSMITSAIFSIYGIHTITKIFGTISIIQYSLIVRPILNCLVALSVMLYSMFTAIPKSSTSFLTLLMTMILTTTLRGLASHTLATGLTTRSTGLVTTQEQGTLLGLEHGLFSMARIVGPTFGTLIYSGTIGTGNRSNTMNFWAVIIACGCIDLSLLSVFQTTQLSNHSPHKNKNP